MQKITLNNQQVIPQLGLGTWQAPNKEVYNAVREAINIGYRHIDCAAIYKNEEMVGKAIHDAIKAGEIQREDLWITSKLWNCDHDPKDVLPGIERTLKALQLDYLDLYLMHWPVAQKHSVGYGIPDTADGFIPLSEMPVLDTWHAMEDLHAKGLSNTLGVSNFSIKKLEALYPKANIKPAVNQVECHPYLAQQDLKAVCENLNMFITAYSPLGSNMTPEANRNAPKTSLIKNPIIEKIAQSHDATPAQVLIAWQLARDVIVIPKSVNPTRLKENFESLNLKLTPNDMDALNDLDQHYRFVKGEIFTIDGSPYTQASLWDE